jgi:hypothetical protein
MATQPRRKLNVGTIIDGTVDVITKNVVPGLIFIVVFAGLGMLTDFLSQGAPIRAALFSLVIALATIIGVYFLLQAMLRGSGLLSYHGAPRILQFLGLGILTGLGTALGFVLFIIPGLILMARWSIASILLVAEGKGITESMGESWEKTRGSEMPIILSVIVLMFLFVCVSVVASLYAAQIGFVGNVVSRIAGAAGNVVSTGLGVAVYGLLTGGARKAEVFQ